MGTLTDISSFQELKLMKYPLTITLLIIKAEEKHTLESLSLVFKGHTSLLLAPH